MITAVSTCLSWHSVDVNDQAGVGPRLGFEMTQAAGAIGPELKQDMGLLLRSLAKQKTCHRELNLL
jgi:hypothetical protein